MKRILLLISVFVGAMQFNAQVSYHDYTPDEVLHATYAGEALNIDFDNDLNPELTLYGTKNDTTFSNYPVTLMGFAMTTYANTQIVGRTTQMGAETILEADTLNVGDLIDGSNTYINSNTPSVFPGVGLTAEAVGLSSVGQFAGAGFKYIGVKFDISGSAHYGWIRVSVSATHDTCYIDSYGYETTASTGIQAGDLGGSTAQIAELESKSKVLYQNGQFNLYNLEGSNVVVYNVLGEIQYSKRVSSELSSIDVNNLNSGVYLVTCLRGTKSVTYKVYRP